MYSNSANISVAVYRAPVCTLRMSTCWSYAAKKFRSLTCISKQRRQADAIKNMITIQRVCFGNLRPACIGNNKSWRMSRWDVWNCLNSSAVTCNWYIEPQPPLVSITLMSRAPGSCSRSRWAISDSFSLGPSAEDAHRRCNVAAPVLVAAAVRLQLARSDVLHAWTSACSMLGLTDKFSLLETGTRTQRLRLASAGVGSAQGC